VIDRKAREFTAADSRALEDLAALVETELQRQQMGQLHLELLRQLSDAERRASVDSLTRVWNREFMLALLEREHERCRREGGSVTVGMIDVDRFKEVNDRHGHAVGDEVLRDTAARLRRALRPYDTLGRYGGEEFLVTLTRCNEAEALVVAERMRKAVAEEAFPTSDGPLPVSISIGLSRANAQAGTTAADALRAADRALYEAKDAGRNRVCVAGEGGGA
jgi:diguanylate cyclase (GGDEF)-like protein